MHRPLEDKLSAALGPVEAPGELWARVNAALPNPRTSRSDHWSRFVMAAALAALMSGGVLYLRAHSPEASFAITAARLHEAPSSVSAAYEIKRFIIDGQPVTVISASTGQTPLAASKKIHTATVGALTVSEWTSNGRRWALVSVKNNHRQACQVCHHA